MRCAKCKLKKKKKEKEKKGLNMKYMMQMTKRKFLERIGKKKINK